MTAAIVPPGRSRGFTLIELMVVVAIISTLVAVAIPRLANAIRSANEGSTLANLGVIRSALSVYYADSEGAYPADLTELLRPGSKYLSQPMSVYTRAHGVSRAVEYVASAEDTDDTGSWAYVNQGLGLGKVFVNCTHTDLKGTQWNQY